MNAINPSDDEDDLNWENIEKRSREIERLAWENRDNVDKQLEFIKNDPSVILSIIKTRGELNHKNSNGITPLMAAFETDDTNLIRKLLDAGADFRARDNDGLSPLGHAVKAGNRRGIECFRDFLADNMIKYPLKQDVSVLSITEGKSSLLELLEPIHYRYSVEVIFRSGKKIEVVINDTLTFNDLVNHFDQITKDKKDDFYKGKGFAFRPKDVSSVVLVD